MDRFGQAVLRLGSVHTPGSVHERALCEAAKSVGAPMRLGSLLLYPHQAEDVICMAAVEKMGPWRPLGSEMLTNVGILGEPGGSGKMVTMIAHVARAARPDPTHQFVVAYDQAKRASRGPNMQICSSNAIRLSEPEEYVPPEYFPLTVVVASPAAAYIWAEAMVAYGGQRVVRVTSRSELNAFEARRDALPGSCDVVVVSRGFVRALANKLRFMRVARLILDDPLDMGGGRFEIRSCFLWLIEHRLSSLISHYGSVPSCVKSALCALNLPAVEDPSPIIVSHSQQEVDVSLGLEYPMHNLYHISVDDSWDVAHLPIPKGEAAAAEQLVARHHIPVWKKETAVRMVVPEVRERLEAQLRSDEGCMICLEAFSAGGTCLLTCCTRLLCCTCVWKIIHTSGTCPNCRGAIADRGAIVVMISDRLDNPLNVSHYFCPHIERRLDVLAVLLARIGLGRRVLIWVGCADHWDEHTGLDLKDLVEVEMNLRAVTFSGTGAQQQLKLIEYQGIGDTAVPDQFVRLATVLTPHEMARGVNLDATTDLIFYSPPSQEQYEYVLSRVINARTPVLRRRSGHRLTVHMLMENEALLPAIKTSQEGIGSGRGSDAESYEAGIARDLGPV